MESPWLQLPSMNLGWNGPKWWPVQPSAFKYWWACNCLLLETGDWTSGVLALSNRVNHMFTAREDQLKSIGHKKDQPSMYTPPLCMCTSKNVYLNIVFSGGSVTMIITLTNSHSDMHKNRHTFANIGEYVTRCIICHCKTSKIMLGIEIFPHASYGPLPPRGFRAAKITPI